MLLSTCTVYVLPISCIHSPKVLTPCREYAIISESPTDFVDWLQAIHKMWSCSFWTQPHKVVGYHRETHHFSEGKSTKEFTAPQHTRSILPLTSPDKIHRCAAWAVFFFFTNKILCSCSIFQNLFLVVGCTTPKCYPCAWKKQDAVSALRPAFFILYLEPS